MRDTRSFQSGLACVALGCFLCAVNLQTILQEPKIAEGMVSEGLWRNIVQYLGGTLNTRPDGTQGAELELPSLLWLVGAFGFSNWLIGGAIVSQRREIHVLEALGEWGWNGWLWWFLPGAWETLHLIAYGMGLGNLQAFLQATPAFWWATMFAGWLASMVYLLNRSNTDSMSWQESYPWPKLPLVAAAIFSVVFVAMNWQLYSGLRIPHGDSAMYEEHLWNFTHGKGFRSYLDQGLFLGEHIQVIHLGLLPLHLLWPSQMLLELCETLALVSGVLPIYWMTMRHSKSAPAAACVAVAYLLYFPVQYLDIAIDLKTFRPTAFGVPLLLFALDQVERRNRWPSIILMGLTLLCQEDFALVLIPFGLWLFATTDDRKPFGLATAIGCAAYLLLATQVLIPWFRGGEEVHYAQYFTKFGNSTSEIALNMVTNPGLLLSELLSQKSALFVVMLLAPLGFAPLFSPTRFAVAIPHLTMLCLNQIASDPRHHFHAPVVPILFWAIAGAWDNLPYLSDRWFPPSWERSGRTLPEWGKYFVLTSALMTGVFCSLSPLGLAFWEPNSSFYWRKLYVAGERAEQFAVVEEMIPREARVASTDFVHPRFTHYERSYDYSGYPRRVSDNVPWAVPEDTDYIVIDTHHPYSTIRQPGQVTQLKEQPDEWQEIGFAKTKGYYIVLKRRSQAPVTEAASL